MQNKWIEQTAAFVKEALSSAEGGHDWWHIYRVWKLAKRIAAQEMVNETVVELAALLHDIADPKFYGGDEDIGPQRAGEFMQSIGIDEDIQVQVLQVIRHMSFKQQFEATGFVSPEMLVVQDADRLDAIGAIGIARTFNYGGFKNRLIYDPNVPVATYATKEAYKNSEAPTINHFYEKLLLLKDLMNTTTGKQLAEARHAFMEGYLEQFFKEWEGLS